MLDRISQIDPMDVELPAFEKSWHVTEKRDVLHLAVPRDIARVRVLDAFRGETTEKAGLLLARTTFSGSMKGDMLDIRYVSRGRASASYVLKGRLLGTGPTSQIVLSIRDNLLWKFALTLPAAFMIPALFALTRGDRSSLQFNIDAIRDPLVLVAILIGGIALAAAFSGVVWLGSLWPRNVALESVKGWLSKIVTGPVV